eukprot:scaffold512605_cov34-Prasinocladus_malaysianus.AAC.1
MPLLLTLIEGLTIIIIRTGHAIGWVARAELPNSHVVCLCQRGQLGVDPRSTSDKPAGEAPGVGRDLFTAKPCGGPAGGKAAVPLCEFLLGLRQQSREGLLLALHVYYYGFTAK